MLMHVVCCLFPGNRRQAMRSRDHIQQPTDHTSNNKAIHMDSCIRLRGPGRSPVRGALLSILTTTSFLVQRSWQHKVPHTPKERRIPPAESASSPRAGTTTCDGRRKRPRHSRVSSFGERLAVHQRSHRPACAWRRSTSTRAVVSSRYGMTGTGCISSCLLARSGSVNKSDSTN